MEKYWLYLEPYTFIWSSDKQFLLYNSLSGDGYTFEITGDILPIILELSDKQNLYSVAITDMDLQNPAICELVNLIRHSFCGDLINQLLCSHKPVTILPELNINEDVYRDIHEIKNYEYIGQKIVRNLTEVSVYLGGSCPNKCAHCDTLYKQLLWCHQEKHELHIDRLSLFLSNLRCASITDVNFLGSDILNYSYFDELFNVLKSYEFNKNFYIDSRLFDVGSRNLNVLVKENYNIYILVSNDVSLKTLNPIIENFECAHFMFEIESESRFDEVSNYSNNLNLKAHFFPFYTGANVRFFEENVFQNVDEIISTSWSKKNIFSHQVLNTNYFGKIILMSDERIYSNMNGKPIGEISDSVKSLIYNEIVTGEYWRKTRDRIKPCRNCLYKYLCPSPSNYELAIGKPNLCNMENI